MSSRSQGYHQHPVVLLRTISFLSGMGTAMVQALITNPYELIKIRQQTVVGQPITETIRELGFRGLTNVGQ